MVEFLSDSDFKILKSILPSTKTSVFIILSHFLFNLKAKRDWGFAGDYIEAMWLMMQQNHPDDYVIAIGEFHSIEEFLSLATEIADLGDWHNFVEIDKTFLRPTDIDELVSDPSQAKKELEWKPKVNFKQLVKMILLIIITGKMEKK